MLTASIGAFVSSLSVIAIGRAPLPRDVEAVGLQEARQAASAERSPGAGDVVLGAAARLVDPDHRHRGELVADECREARVLVDQRRTPELVPPLLERDSVELLVRDVVRHLHVELVEGLGVVEVGEGDDADSVGNGVGRHGARIHRGGGRGGDLGEPEARGQCAGARLVDRAAPRRRHAKRREVLVRHRCERSADPLTAPTRVDGDHQGAPVWLGDPPFMARGAPADDLAGLLPGEHQELGPLRDVLERVAHALCGEDLVRPRTLTHRRGARDVVERPFADHGAEGRRPRISLAGT